ncbi:sulfurtransferase [Paenibacillus beijingensis]|uniref:3-mercaptopyruvate sulfurtransferase n=1 Tax=Paenibacillus beijingensis TaxID=1126833 RepID=A0A0D5NI70_9BACL|nr:sulfurtransferase [Paenibacillus beijingensis]AJY74981.1 3-mercaptopyruvate sulfurtransferase [Paenibacillus beijingensis]
MNETVSLKWLLARLYEPDLVIVDCRSALGKPGAGREAFEEAHIPGAVHLDLEQDLSGPLAEHGGRHPLPEPARLAEVFGKAGISADKRVVAYDDQGGMMAARLWWLLRYTGHEAVYVTDQGFTAWREAGYPVTKDEPVRIPARYIPALKPEMLASVEDVRQASESGDIVLIDSREPRRYLGEEEPIDAKAGHIPGAVNKFWKHVLDENGRWRSGEEARELFQDIPADKEIIVYCGSGVSACPNVLALRAAGYGNVKLYAGSWSDWISYGDKPIATGDE